MDNSGNRGPSRAWFILPSALLLVAVVLGSIAVVSFVNFARADFTAYQPNSSISVTDEGLSLYVEEGSLSAADLRLVSCTATGPDGQTPLRALRGRTVLNQDGATFMAIASTPARLPAGTYALACQISSSAGLDQPLFVGPRVDIARVGMLAVLGVVAPLFLGLCSVVLFAILGFLRYQAGRNTRVPVSAGSGPYAAG